MFSRIASPADPRWSGIGELSGPELQELLAERDAMLTDDPWPDVEAAWAAAQEPDPLVEIGRLGRAAAMFQGAQLIAIATFMINARLEALHAGDPRWSPEEAMASAEAEIALVLGVAAPTASRWIDLAVRLAERVPNSLDAVADGVLTVPKARAMLEETENLPLEDAAKVESDLLPTAAHRTPGNLRRAARRAVMRLDAEAATKRRERARAEREVRFWPVEDGMARLEAYLPAEDAVSVFGVIDTLAHAARHDGDDRPIGALRADALLDLILHPGAQRRVTHTVHVTVTAETLLGLRTDPADLHGYGPIGAEVAREIAADATWIGLFSDAATLADDSHAGDNLATPGPGAGPQAPRFDPGSSGSEPASTGLAPPRTKRRSDSCDCPHARAAQAAANRYPPSAKLAAAVRARDRHCRFPGCRAIARHADLDHTLSFRIGGRTITINLAVLCRRHHRVKHLPGWHLHQAPTACSPGPHPPAAPT